MVAAVALGLFGVLAATAHPGGEAATIICLILLALLALVLGVALFLFYRAVHPTLSRGVMEELVIGLVRDDPDLAQVANRLYTTKQGRRIFHS